jgi:predicted metal-dependent enzyme (double-stranded beta helix superfamily)
LIDALRDALRDEPEPAVAAQRAADCLRTHRPGPDVLSPTDQEGDTDHYQQHVLYVDPQLKFSVVALVWRAGQQTTIHDHRCWCSVAVLRGREYETLYSLGHGDDGPCLIAGRSSSYLPGEVSAFAPPGDIHRVRNSGSSTAISLHVYGADICALGTSIRRNYPDTMVVTP